MACGCPYVAVGLCGRTAPVHSAPLGPTCSCREFGSITAGQRLYLARSASVTHATKPVRGSAYPVLDRRLWRPETVDPRSVVHNGAQLNAQAGFLGPVVGT